MSRPRAARGFTIIELLVTLLVVVAAFGTGWYAFSAMMDNQRANEADRTLALIRDRLIDFAVRNGRLPCPADPEASGANLGQEWLTTSASGLLQVCSVNGNADQTRLASGAIPWATLRVPETDPWGQRYEYTVDVSWAEISTACDPLGLPQVPNCWRTPPDSTQTLDVFSGGARIAADLAVVVISHGANGAGGFRTDGQRRVPLPASASDEDANLLKLGATPTRDYRLRDRGPGFDDQLIYIPRHILVARLVEAGRAR